MCHGESPLFAEEQTGGAGRAAGTLCSTSASRARAAQQGAGTVLSTSLLCLYTARPPASTDAASCQQQPNGALTAAHGSGRL